MDKKIADSTIQSFPSRADNNGEIRFMKDTKFKPGNTGRPKGAKNRALCRARIETYIESNWDKFQKELNSLKGRAYVENFLKMLPYVTPAYQSISFSLRNMSDDDLKYLIEKIKETNEQQEPVD